MRKSKIISIILVMALLVMTVLIEETYAAGSFSVSTSSSTVTVGETVTITITGNDAYGTVKISASSGTLSATKVFLEGDSKTVTLTTDTEGTVKITVSPAEEGLGDSDENPITGSKSATVTVKAKQTTPDPTPTPTPEPEPEPTPTPEPEKPTEPTFTDTNRTMYSTGNINLRASWSTSSSATSIEEGTELTVTGTSKEKVNGYVWYRVSYNGQTKYVASNLLTSTKPEEETKSDNANLKSLVVENYEIVPNFSTNVTEYTLDVTSEVTELSIKAEPEDSKAIVTIKGEKELKDGENTIIISVDAEDGTTKLYEIKVTKKEKEENVFGLTSLKIKDTNIQFKPDVYNYNINIKSNIDILEIQAIASEEDATVEILGNESLKEGENIITIIVSSKDGEKKATYQITANKEAVKEEKTPRNVQSNSKIFIYAGIGAIVLIALIIVIVYTVKHRKEDEDDSEKFEGFPDELPERDEYEEEHNSYNEIDNQDEDDVENEIKQEYDEKIDRKNYFLDTNNEEDFEKPRKRRGKHF